MGIRRTMIVLRCSAAIRVVSQLASFTGPQNILGILGLSQVIHSAGKLVSPNTASQPNAMLTDLRTAEAEFHAAASAITRDEATDMILAACMGTLYTGDDAEQPYRARLTAMIDALVAGLGRDAKV